MEFVVISGGTVQQAEVLANVLRAHGYRSISPELYFVDDFGDSHTDVHKRRQAEIWCEHHAMYEVKHHHDVVVHGIFANPALLYSAEQEGYHVSMIRLDQSSEEICQHQVELLAAEHDRVHQPWFKRVFSR
jgi:hypothetical protein